MRHTEHRLSRRRFLGAAALAGAGALGLPACGGPVRTVVNETFLTLPEAEEAGRVTFAWETDRDMRALCERVVSEITDMSWLSRGDSVFLKVSSNSDNVHPAVTCPDAVSAMVALLRDRGAGTVYVGDQAGVEHVRLLPTGRVSSTREVLEKNGILTAAVEAGAVIHCFDDQGWDGYFRAESDFEDHWGGGVWLPKIVNEVDHIINLPRLGNHAVAGYTGAVKIAVGWLRDDSRRDLHVMADTFFERYAEISHFRPLRSKLRFSLTLGDKALLNIGPDFGSEYDFEGVVAVGSEGLVEHDLLSSAILAWLDEDDSSFFDLYAPYPDDVDHWNKGLAKEIWGEDAVIDYRTLVAFEPARGIAYDRALSHLSTLQRHRPAHVKVALSGDRMQEELVAWLRSFGGGVFAV